MSYKIYLRLEARSSFCPRATCILLHPRHYGGNSKR